jgi:hypothetical protein
MQTITLSNETANNLRRVAALRGIDADTYADELLSISLAVLEGDPSSRAKSRRVMDYSAIAPTGRSAVEIDADIEAGRTEWDNILLPQSSAQPRTATL